MARQAAPSKAAAERDALFGDKPVSPSRAAPSGWSPDGTEIVTCRKVVERENGVRAVLCDHPTMGSSWVSFGSELADAAVENRRVELTWEFDERGGYMRAVEVRGAPKLSEMMEASR